MRIAHVVTLISADGAFGGPVSVARNQAIELARRGHDVTLLAGWDGVAACALPDVDVQLHRVRKILPSPGFSGLVTPSLWNSLRLQQRTADVVHVHLARDLVTMTAALEVLHSNARLVTQTHGMVVSDERLLARITDNVATRRVLQGAHAVTALTELEGTELQKVGGRVVSPVELPNGIGMNGARSSFDQLRPRVVFCARLHPRKRVLAFAEMAQILVNSGIEADFVVAGPDEGDLDSLTAYISARRLGAQVKYVGALTADKVRSFLAESAVFVLPSEREPFPMTLLEAMAEGTPAVITDGCMIANQLKGSGGPRITDGSPSQLAEEVRMLLLNTARAREIGDRSRKLVSQRFSIGAVVDRLEKIYSS